MKRAIPFAVLLLSGCGQYLAEREYAKAEENGATSAKLCRLATEIAEGYDGTDREEHTKWAAKAAMDCLRASLS